MKLVNYSLMQLCVILVVVISLFTVVFYFIQLDEITDSIDDGLENFGKELVYLNKDKAASEYDLPHLKIRAVDRKIDERYIDTTLYFVSEKESEPVRMYETGFKDHSGQYYRLQVFSPAIESDDLIEAILKWLAFLSVTLLAIIFLYSLMINRVWKPFYSLLHQLDHFKLSQSQEVNMPKTPIVEFNQMERSVHALLQENIQVYEAQKRFIENAAHELQTPLAISIGKLELLLEEEMSQHQAHTIDAVLGVLERMKRLNTTLLLVSKIKNKQFVDKEDICFNLVFDEVLSIYEELLHHQNITVSKREDAALDIKMNRDLAFMLVSNLIKNAIVHNINNGEISISIHAASVEISNTGKPEAIQSQKIFNRYYNQSENTYSMGLGLSIIKSITDFYGFDIDYLFREGTHSFILRIH